MTNRETSIAVVGAGAIGGWVAAKLALSGSPVMALASRGPLESLQLSEGSDTRTASFTSFDGPADVLLIAVKAPALEAAAEAARPLLGEETVVVPMLNGVPWWFVEDMPLKSVDPSGRIAAALPLDTVVGCVVHASCSRPEPGRIAVSHADKLILGEPGGGSSNRVERLAGLFEEAGIACERRADVRRAIWYKLWGNATINPLSAVVRATCDRILEDPECRAWMLQGMTELGAIGAAIGCPIAESGEDRMAVTARLGAFKTSMLQDVEAGRAIELEALLGAPREIARRFDIPTPALDRLYAVTRMMGESSGLL